ncbi:ribosome 60S biogenesis N-terminal-domain-containing protein [Mycena amicta]|nr:ribosome 60S biogenesis N-terminal-domain-containing protein [Mycena amicta]
MRTLLTPPWMKKLNSYLGGAHNELLLVTLKLFNTISAFGRGKERKTLLESFAWETKSLPKLLNMRRRSKGDQSSDALAKPDIRTLYVLFCLSFVEQDTAAAVKTMFLEQHRDAFFSIFRGIAQDPFVVVRRVLEICWSGIWMDLKLKRTLKIGLFGEITVAHLLKIYERSSSEDNLPDHVPADVAHHFLLAICTRPGVGICFKDKGWYPRKSDVDGPREDEDPRPHEKAGKIYNKILANVLKTLKINEDPRQQELALKIMTACPELVAGYWSAAGLTLEPRLSFKWIANISFFSSVLALPIPTDSFLLENGVLYQPTPPPLSIVLENTFPSVGTKLHFSKGLQQSSGLVQHCAALALSKCLSKYSRVLQAFRSVESALEEDESDGQWAKLRQDLEREVRHRVPEFQVIVAFASGQGMRHASDPTKAALLAECAQRLMWLYHYCLPQLIAESRFDVGKLVQNLSELDGAKTEEDRDSAARLNVVRQLHVLRLLNESDQFQWSGKTASDKTHSHVLLDAFCSCKIPALQRTMRSLIVNFLSQSVIFYGNPDEPSLWISAIPLASMKDEPPEGLSHSEAATEVVAFLDDCIQRCLKKSNQYIEEMQALQFSDLPSPLIMTALEQLRAKSTSMQPSHLLAIVMFLRRVVLRLSSVQRDLAFLLRIVERIDQVLSGASPATRRQISAMRQHLPPTHIGRALDDADITSHPRFDSLFVNAAVSDIAQRRETLINAISPIVADFKQAICLVGHSLNASQHPKLTGALVRLLASICTRAAGSLSTSDFSELKEHVFIRSPAMVRLCTSADVSDEIVLDISGLLNSILDDAKREDREILSSITSHWLDALINGSSFSSASSPWIRYMDPSDLLSVLRTLGQETVLRGEPLELVISALETAVKAQAIPDIYSHMDLLTKLRSTLPDSSALEGMIAAVVDACVPTGLSGRPLPYSDISTVSLLRQAEAAWCQRARLRRISALELYPFLYQEQPWADSTVKIILALLYRSAVDVDVFETWLSTDSPAERSTVHLLRVVHAYLDVLDGPSPRTDNTGWTPYLSRFIAAMVDESTSSVVRGDAESCLRLLLRRIPGSSVNLIAAFKKQLKSFAENSGPTAEALRLGVWLAKHVKDAKPVPLVLLDHGIQWCIAAFAELEVNTEVVDELASLVKNVKVVDSDVAQTLAGVIIQNRLGDAAAVSLLSAVLQAASFKPLIVNRLLQSIVQHPHFFKVCAGSTRTQVINVLHVIFNLHPANTCQATHVQPLVRIYCGTCSRSDRQLLGIFQLFEAQRKVSVASLFAQWSASEGSTSSNALEAIQTLDAALILRTCLHFPKWRTLEDQVDFCEPAQDAPLYDPAFIMLLFAQAMAEKVPESAFGWIEMFRTNVVSLLIRVLSCKEIRTREVAMLQLAALWAHLEFADMQEQPHVVYVLNILRNTLPSSSAGPLRRLPSYTTLVLAHALRGIFYPSNFIYPVTARFLLQRPTLDTTDVPLLYGMLYNSGDDWKKERGWIIRFISDGMMSTDDWRVLKRRHTWELLAGLFQSSEHAISLRSSILEVLANLTCNTQATTSLILKASLLHWIEMQLLVSTTGAVSWIKILENILLIVDPLKLESSTGGEWRSVICRCLLLVVDGASQSAKLGDIASLASSVTLRLCSLPGPVPAALGDLLSACLKATQVLEAQLDIPSYRTTLRPSSITEKTVPLPPYRGADLAVADERDALVRWGRAVEDLWQSVMRLPDRVIIWDALMCRLLVWRTVVGEDGSPNGEWTRQMSLRLCHT